MQEDADRMLAEAAVLLDKAQSPLQVNEVRVRYLGRKGEVAALIGRIPQLPAQERPAAGRAANELKQRLGELVAAAQARVAAEREGAAPCPDPTLPAVRPPRGSIHPVSQIIEEIADIFR
ncbi:MAG: phenylalanine--tRNA ligase subunit alpha, partial [Planctomycetota bacterium]